MTVQKIRPFLTGSAVFAGLTLLAGCGGAVGSGGASGTADGFTYGAAQEEVSAAVAELDPVTLKIQPYAASPDAEAAVAEQSFMDAVEERSDGKITFDVAWGQSIAGYPEVDDALADGRLDISYSVPIYFPGEYPLVDAYNKLSHYTTAGPLTGEAITQAQMSEAGWNHPEVLAEYTDKGLTPLNPLVTSGNYWAACNAEGTSPEDWQGRQIRIGGSAQTPISEAIGASPVSMEYGETYEALQRSTVDCTFIQGMVAGSTGLLEVAPHVSTFGEERMTGAVTAGHVAGSRFDGLPLPYQQIIFDAANIDWFHGQIAAMVGSSGAAVSDVKAAGGTFTEIDQEVEDSILATQEELVDGLIAEGVVDEGLRSGLQDGADKWTGIVEEMGYTDAGDLSELDEWYDADSTDFRPLGERVFEEGALAHRPE
ncbi:MAG TPA: C4-dicarboxylate ABC transporter substrate-binding protein [Brevibacterium sp.]|nr:C4-dicarboxylate ABC transporter substrate-binding protein [Brevibacterium sp.]